MIPLNFNKPGGEGLKILCLGAHCDDIEIGCGATLLKMIRQYRIERIEWVVFASNDQRRQEAIEAAGRFLEEVPEKNVRVLSYRDAFLPHSALEIKEEFEQIKTSLDPDLIFTHYRDDRHQDHRLISDLTWNTWRHHLILEYEIPKYDGDLGHPNLFVRLTEELVGEKISILQECYATQRSKHWFDEETFKALMRIRGMESAHQQRYAEAFYARKITI